MRILLLALICLTLSCKTETSEIEKEMVENITNSSESAVTPLEVYDFEGLKPLLKTNTDKVYVVNFWATWCAPCVKELPYFEELNTSYKDQKVEVILVSLDFPKKYDSHLKPFIKEKGLKSRVVALNDADSNSWIPQVSPDWSGAIPATIIFNKNKRQFYEQSFTYDELETELQHFLK